MLLKTIVIISSFAISFYANEGHDVKLNHNGKEITVNVNAVQKHLDHGDTYIDGLQGGGDDSGSGF